jgi:hypothetical protein
MAQLLAINDVIRAQIVTVDNEQAAFNTVYYKVTGVGVSVANLHDFAVNWSALVAPKVKPMIYNGATFDGVISQIISPLPLMARDLYSLDSGVGTGGAIGAPRQSAPIIGWRTDFAGPGFRGRMYMPFMSSSHLAGYGLASNAYVALMVILANAIQGFTAVSNGGRTATVEQVLWRRAGSITTPVTSNVTSPDIGTQKRRGTFGRANLAPV